MKRTLDGIGKILLLGFVGCLTWLNIATEFTANQYIATLCATVVMGGSGMILIRIASKKNTDKKSEPILGI